MSIGEEIGKIISKGAPYSDAIKGVSDVLSGVLKRVLPEKMDETTGAKINQEITMALLNGELQPMLAQLAVNAKEAEHDSVFVAGWRPFIGWVCGSGLAYATIGQPFLTFLVVAVAWLQSAPGTPFPSLPTLDVAQLVTLLFGMLGISTLRSYEKIKGETTTATKVGA